MSLALSPTIVTNVNEPYCRLLTERTIMRRSLDDKRSSLSVLNVKAGDFVIALTPGRVGPTEPG